MQRPGQSRDDIVRRSAGLPAAFVALFTAEPTGHPKTLLYTGMRELLRVAGDDSQQEPWARVHAINTLRLTFSDRNLANDVSGFFAEGLQVAIVAMGGGAWEVRNAASLIFTALLIRMLGFRNLVKGESARRAITGAEFFNRYPSLHHFLLTQLKAATHQLEQGAAVVHPSLTPVLALLSRLRPSLHNQSTSADDPLSPALFTEAVQSCATASQMAVRHLAAAALAPLTPPEELAPTLLRLLATATASPAPNLNVVHGCLSQAKQIRKNCWQSILYSSAEISEPFSRLQDSTLPSGFQDSGERQPSEANDPSLEGQVKVGDRQPAKVQGPNLDAHNDSVPLSSSHHAQTPMEHASILAQSAGVQQPNKPSQYSCSQSVHSDAADPLMSLWLKNVTLLFFGHDLQKHLLGGMSSNNEGTQCSLSEDEVQVALKSGNYDVRAACLKALVRRNAAGEALPQFDDIRLAAAVALEASGLLSCQAHMHQPWQGSSRLTVPALQAWVIVVTMMEDEDSEVRAAASGAAGAALQALGDEGVSYGAHVELVLRHAFDLLGSCCLHLPVMQQHMLDLLYRPQSSRLFKASTSKQHNHECSSAAAASPKQPQTQPQGPPIPAEGTANGGEPQPDGDMPAKGCQLDPGLRVVVWANAAEQDLLGMTQSIAQLQKHETLFGGVANHGDVLQPVYCMLLALHTAGQSPHVKARLPSVLGSVQTAAAELSDVAYQPLIAAMLKTTLAVWPEPEVHDSSEELISQHGHSWSYTFLTGKQDALKGKQEGAPCRTQI
ncbi:hypothetical protein WJX79_002523 [Trebouxia sp. C0005]